VQLANAASIVILPLRPTVFKYRKNETVPLAVMRNLRGRGTVEPSYPPALIGAQGHGGGFNERLDLSGRLGSGHIGGAFLFRSEIRTREMALESAVTGPAVTGAHDLEPKYLQWTPVIAGALAATALSLIFVTFAAAVGLGVSSTAPTWRDASAALWILSGLYLILQAIISFGFGAYIAGRLRRSLAAGPADEVETRDGLHGLAVWAIAVVLGAVLAAFVGAATINRTSPSTANASAAEPLLSYELDRLFRSARRPPNVDLRSDRAEAGRVLLTSSGHDGVSADDRAYLIQQVGATTGLSPADAEHRVDNGIANAKTALTRSRRSTIILAFSLATALLLGAVAAWAAACAGGRHRDGAPLPEWMAHSDRFARRRIVIQ
jgi:hypothetical protein